MFGKNPIRKQELTDGQTLSVKEVFMTLQGEGPHSGLPAVFIRLAGCNLTCEWCDTDFESDTAQRQIHEIVSEVIAASEGVTCALVVLTGGEPLRQNIVPLCQAIADYGFLVQIETNGTYWVPGLEELIEDGNVEIVCSPKTGKVHASIENYCCDWKYVLRADRVDLVDYLPTEYASTGQFGRVARPPKDGTVYVQPCDEQHNLKNYKNLQLCVKAAMQRGYRVSLQLHKIIGLP